MSAFHFPQGYLRGKAALSVRSNAATVFDERRECVPVRISSGSRMVCGKFFIRHAVFDYGMSSCFLDLPRYDLLRSINSYLE